MTLVLNAFNTEYIIMTSDSRIIINHHDSSGNLVSKGEPELTEEIGSKVIRVSDRVLYGMGGAKEAHDLILERLLKQVCRDDDLKKVSRLVETICMDLKENNRFFQFIMKGPGFGTYLSGFLRNGRTGRVEIRGFGTLTVEKKQNPSWGMLPPSDLRGNVNTAVFHIGKSNDLMDVVASCHKIHALFAYSYPECVSDDCTVYALKKDGKKILFEKQTIDTTFLFESLPPKEDVIDFITVKDQGDE